MKTLNLNIKLNEPVKSEDGKTDLTGRDVAVRWIGIMIERAINKPDPRTLRPTVGVTMDVQRKYFRVMNMLEGAKDGMVTLEDEDFKFMESKFDKAEIPVQKGIAEILVAIEGAMNKAKVGVKKDE